jgi:hypothetical protein
MTTCGLALLLAMGMPAVAPAAGPTPGLTADPALQAAIGGAIEDLNAGTSEAARRQAVDQVSNLAGSSLQERVRLLEQLQIFLSTASGTVQALGGALLLHRLEFGRD